MESHPALSVEEAYIGPGLSMDAIRSVEAAHGLTLESGVKAYYREVNGVIVRWSLDPSRSSTAIEHLHCDYEEPVFGAVNMMALEEVAPPWTELRDSAWDAGMGLTAKQELAEFRPFDDNVEEAFVGFVCKEGRIRDQLHYLRQGEEYLYDTQSDIAAYIEALAQSRGFYWWQEAYSLRPAGFNQSEMFHYVKQLFPAEEFSSFSELPR